ncbi:MAG: hypothetical protein ACREDI_12270 [Roseiarcus sp.]
MAELQAGAREAAIALGGRNFTVRPLTLRQLRTILPAFGRAAQLTAEAGVDAAIDIIASALARDHAALTRDALLDMEVMPSELAGAIGVIAKLSGLVEPGEAQAGR